jgi:hypothetical protein
MTELREFYEFYCASVPVKNITMGRKDPEYITPLVKSFLRQRNKLRHKGHIAEADKLAIKINKLITDKRQRMLNKLTFAGTRELWAAVKKTAVPASMFDYDLLSDPDEVNDYFAGICTTNTHNIDEVEKYRSILGMDKLNRMLTIMKLKFYYALFNELLLAEITYQLGYLDTALLN